MEMQATSTAPGRAIAIDAKPEAVTIDTRTTAAIVVDMQNDFCTKGGMFDRAGIDVSRARAAVRRAAAVLEAIRKAGISVVYLKMGFGPDLSDLGAIDSPTRIKHLPMAIGTTVVAPDGRESRILIRDTWNTEIVDELKPRLGETVLYKTRYSGFYETDLDKVLKKRDIKSLIVMGVSTSVCVESTLRDAVFRDYRCLLLSDCSAEPIGQDLPRSNHDASILVIQVLFGWVSESAEVIRALASK
jgi:ureidoacrylate peracid hydrolase